MDHELLITHIHGHGTFILGPSSYRTGDEKRRRMPWDLRLKILLVALIFGACKGEDFSSTSSLAQSMEVTKAVEGCNHPQVNENSAV